MHSVTDADLARRAAAGDPDAFGALVERWSPAVRRVTRAALGDPDEADDAAQDAFLSAWTNVGSYDPTRPFGPWILRIATNRAFDRGRRKKVRAVEPLHEDRPSGKPGPDTDLDHVAGAARPGARQASPPPAGGGDDVRC